MISIISKGYDMRKRVFKFIALFFMAIIGVSLWGMEARATSIAEGLRLDPVLASPKNIVIPVTEKSGKASLQFPAADKRDGKTLCIRFRAFLATEKPAGWNYNLQMKLNGHPLTALLDDNTDRILNRGAWLKSTVEGDKSWFGGTDRPNSIITFFGPESGEMDYRLKSPRDEGYWYVVNLSDAANYLKYGPDDRVESNIPNVLTFQNDYTLLNMGETASCKEMRISDITIGYMSSDDFSKLSHVNYKPLPSQLKGNKYHAGDGTLTVNSAGAMELNIGKDRYLFGSSYSYPAKPMGFHQMTWEKVPDAGWKVYSNGDKICGECDLYRITRYVKPEKNKIRVFEKIENKTDNPIGLSLRSFMDLPRQPESGDVYQAGQPDIKSIECYATNPSEFIRQKESSVGILVEDDLSRLQLIRTCTGNRVEWGSDHFGLRPHESYTREWSLYPSKSKDYFDFVNTVRRDWKVNFTIPGGFVFNEDGDTVPGRDVRVFAFSPWMEYIFENDLTWTNFTKTHQPRLKKLFSWKPDAIPLASIDTNLVPLPRNVIEDGNKIPIVDQGPGRAGTYGQTLSKEDSEILKKSAVVGKWWDSMMKTEDGRIIFDTYYVPKSFIDLMVYPQDNNYQTQFMLSQVDYAMDKVGFKGIYADQYTIMGRSLKSVDRSEFSKWDGHTVDLNENGEITRKYTDICYVGISARKKITQHVIDKGGLMVVNGHCVDSSSRPLHFVRFAETEWVDWDPLQNLHNEPPVIDAMAEGHLDTPVALGIRPDRFGDEGKDHFAELIQKWAITGLKNGQLYYYYASRIPTEGKGTGGYGIINHMFPFTPVELHAGWMVGKERILTAKSGKFNWPHTEKPEVLAFDLKGLPIKPRMSLTQKGNGWTVDLKLDDWNETAVMEFAKHESNK